MNGINFFSENEKQTNENPIVPLLREYGVPKQIINSVKTLNQYQNKQWAYTVETVDLLNVLESADDSFSSSKTDDGFVMQFKMVDDRDLKEQTQIVFDDWKIHFDYKNKRIIIGKIQFTQSDIKCTERRHTTVLIKDNFDKKYEIEFATIPQAKYAQEKLLSFKCKPSMQNIERCVSTKKYLFANNKTCISIYECNYIKNVFDVLINYQLMYMNNSQNDFQTNLVQLCKDKYPSLLDDYIHIVTEHNSHIEDINNFFESYDDFKICNSANC
eukprot:356285_1